MPDEALPQPRTTAIASPRRMLAAPRTITNGTFGLGVEHLGTAPLGAGEIIRRVLVTIGAVRTRSASVVAS